MEPIQQQVVELNMDVKRGLIRRMGGAMQDYLRRLVNDYTAVIKDIASDAKRRPVKTISIGATLLGLIYTFSSNPNERALQSRLAELRQQMILIPMSIHNSHADNCLEKYTALWNENRLKYLDCWFFTLLLENSYNKKNNFYAAQDRTTRQWPWFELWENCLDIGAFGRFWMLEKCFKNCDIRDEEFSLAM